MSTFQIGQLIFVVSNKTQTVLPGLIQEETRSRNLNGELVSYKVLVGPPGSPKSKVFDLSRVDGDVYGSTEEVKEIMLRRFTEFVDSICSKAQQNANEWYGGISIGGNQVAGTGPGDKVDPEAIMNDLTNGQNQQQQGQPQYVQIQGNQAFPTTAGSQPMNFQQARRQTQQRMMGDGNPTQLIEMPDGTLKEVKININNPKQ